MSLFSDELKQPRGTIEIRPCESFIQRHIVMFSLKCHRMWFITLDSPKRHLHSCNALLIGCMSCWV